MSTVKISQLTQLVSPATNDELLITDVSASLSKKITVSGLLNAYSETDPVVGAVNGLVKADGSGNISAATAGTDYLTDSSTNTLTNKSGNISQWTNDSGYLTSFTESDPVFSASDAAGISSTDITNWDTAYGWGDHASAGYLTSYTETDPVYTASSWYATTNNAANWDTAYGWGDHASAGYLTGITGQSIEDLSDVAAMTPTDGQLLTWNNTGSYWEAADAPVSLPSQTGHSGEYLTTDGSTASWAAVSSNTTSAGLYEMANTISSNYSITSGNNAMSAGPITINSGISVTVPTGSVWSII